MPDLILTPAIILGALALRSTKSGIGSAVSTEGEFAHTHVTQVWDRFDSTISLQGPHGGALSDLENLIAEHSLPGWDGDSALPVSFVTAQNAREFLKALPASLASPELAVDPDDSAISLEWYGGYRKVFSVSINTSGRLACAGLDGTDQWHAALQFDGTNLPPFITESIKRVCV